MLIISIVRKIFKKVKKSVARNGKSSTFAPAKREGKARLWKGFSEKFFESLRPAQGIQRDAGNRNLVRNTAGAAMRPEAETRDSEKNKLKQ